MYIFLLLLVFGISACSITALFCDSCVYYSELSNTVVENHSFSDKVIPYDESCRATKNSYPNLTLAHSCSNKDNACAFVSIKNSDRNEVTLRKCLVLASPELMNKCGKYTEQVQGIKARSAYLKIFNNTDVLRIKFCFCNKHLCGPHSQHEKISSQALDIIITASNIVHQNIAKQIGEYQKTSNVSTKSNGGMKSTTSAFGREHSLPPKLSPTKSTSFATTIHPVKMPTSADTTESYIFNSSSLHHSSTKNPISGVTSSSSSTTDVVPKYLVASNTSTNGTHKLLSKETAFPKVNATSNKAPLFVLILIPVSTSLLVLFAILVVLTKRFIVYSRFVSEFVEHNDFPQ